jgi:hypothetical protein
LASFVIIIIIIIVIIMPLHSQYNNPEVLDVLCSFSLPADVS